MPLKIVVVAGLVAASLGAAVAFGATRPTTKTTTTTVTVVATEFKFALSKQSIPVGTVVFKVVNRGQIGHDFKIAGKKTPIISPGHSATLKVVFKKKGRYAYLCDVPGHAEAGMKGVLSVGVTAPPPTTSTTTATTTTTTTTTTTNPGPGGTVQVSMFEYGFTFTPSTIPSGNVTFVLSNTGSVIHNLDITGVMAGPFVDPGKSASMTVNLQAGRTYAFVCDVPGHAAAGMQGSFTPTP